nr:MAG TPA: hypothetical protein [Caudoviricetes sp.]
MKLLCKNKSFSFAPRYEIWYNIYINLEKGGQYD